MDWEMDGCLSLEAISFHVCSSCVEAHNQHDCCVPAPFEADIQGSSRRDWRQCLIVSRSVCANVWFCRHVKFCIVYACALLRLECEHTLFSYIFSDCWLHEGRHDLNEFRVWRRNSTGHLLIIYLDFKFSWYIQLTGLNDIIQSV